MQIEHRGLPIDVASKALIMLHGRGGTSWDILNLGEQIAGADFYIVAPAAPNNVWYPYSFMEEEKLNEPELSYSIQGIKDLIDETAKHIPKERIYIAGFSQGACLALEVSSRFAEKYGGVIAFIGGLIGMTIDEKKYHGNFEGTSVFISNSEKDPHVPLERSQESQKLMEKLGAKVTLKVCKGHDHKICEDEINFVKTHIIG